MRENNLIVFSNTLELRVNEPDYDRDSEVDFKIIFKRRIHLD